VTDHDRRVTMLAIYLAILAGCAAVAELIFVVVRWALGD
jgi:hypothetical protein